MRGEGPGGAKGSPKSIAGSLPTDPYPDRVMMGAILRVACLPRGGVHGARRAPCTPPPSGRRSSSSSPPLPHPSIKLRPRLRVVIEWVGKWEGWFWFFYALRS
uniref:Uncharacterized protein n=1 Tax=Morchella brunnea TaxID=1174671 RepID=A0A8K1MH70_9PEZI|nr:hypothetical protein LK370_mgp255 [Morchella brunnea]UBU98340.1 hypothetical protein [Morchella brunnea]